jgi:hypothetical protein
MKTLVFAAIRCFSIFTAVAGLSFAYPAKANLITNPGFETGDFTGWTQHVGNSVVSTFNGVSPHSGNFQALVFPPLGQSVATTPGQSYTIDFWAASQDFSQLTVVWGGSNVFSHFFAGPTGYIEFTFNVTAASASTLIFFQATSSLFLDDISVNPRAVGVPDTGSRVSLLTCALLGLAALRRKLPLLRGRKS